jgi:hypothetical protein
MAGPWERFQATAAAPETKPWEKFQPSGPVSPVSLIPGGAPMMPVVEEQEH